MLEYLLVYSGRKLARDIWAKCSDNRLYGFRAQPSQGLHSLSGRTSYHKLHACQISERGGHYEMQSRGFEISRDLARAKTSVRLVKRGPDSASGLTFVGCQNASSIDDFASVITLYEHVSVNSHSTCGFHSLSPCQTPASKSRPLCSVANDLIATHLYSEYKIIEGRKLSGCQLCRHWWHSRLS